MPLACGYAVGQRRDAAGLRAVQAQSAELGAAALSPPRGSRCWRSALARGFTLIELLVVVAVIAIATAAISLAMRDPASAQLEREAERLTALFEGARAEARAAGLSVRWMPVQDQSGDQFRFLGLPERVPMPRRWLGEAVAVEIAGATAVRLGPEPVIGAQRLRLRLGAQQLDLVSDGLGPFTAQAVATDTP